VRASAAMIRDREPFARHGCRLGPRHPPVRRSFLLNGIESPLTWATIAAWAVADTALVATMVGQTRTNHRPAPHAAKGRPPGDRRAAAELSEMIELVLAQRSTDTATGTTVVLVATGRNKIAVIKALREALQTASGSEAAGGRGRPLPGSCRHRARARRSRAPAARTPRSRRRV